MTPLISYSRINGMKKKVHWIPVVAGFVIKQGQVLIGERISKDMDPAWEFPGGKIEWGESPEEALTRELREELSIEAEVGDLKLACTHSYKNTGIVLIFYSVPYWKGEVKLDHYEKIKWVHPEELKDLPILESNRKVLDQILTALGDK